MSRRAKIGAFSALIVVCACQWIVGINDRSIYDGGTDGGPDPCANTDVPPNPGASTSSPSDSVTVTAALSKIMLGTTDAGPYYGFNLDQTCTCPGPESCSHGGSSPGPTCDDPNGIDNYARRIFEQINDFATGFGVDGGLITETKLNQAITTGLSGALIEIMYYNGKSDDGSVTVTVYGSLGSEGYPTPPAFDGGDRWYVDPASKAGAYKTSNAYVANYTLVAAMDFPIIVGSAVTQPVYIQLQAGHIKAQLVTDSSGTVTKLTGVLGGRWDPGKFLPSLQVVPDPTGPDGSFLCKGDPVYDIVVKGTICKNTDLNIDPTTPGLCNAVSMGLGFEATPAVVGNVKAPYDAGSPCGANYTDQCPP